MQKENLFFFSFPSASNFGKANVTKKKRNGAEIFSKTNEIFSWEAEFFSCGGHFGTKIAVGLVKERRLKYGIH